MSLLVAALLATAGPAGVPAPPARAGECRWVHGRFAIYNGSGVRRIWIIGTRRIVALLDDDDDIPSAIQAYQRNAHEHRGLEDSLFGDFHVCARERSRPGRMQHIRLLGTRNLIFKGRPFRDR